MTLRPWVLCAFLLGGIGLNAYLVLDERVAASEKHVRHELEKADPLADLRFTRASRQVNLDRLGLADAELEQALGLLASLDDQEQIRREKIARYLDEAGDQNQLADVFCGGGQVHPRYAALAYLVKDEGGVRKAIDLGRVDGLDREAWSRQAPIAQVYGDLELAQDRKPDATVMGVAAILLGREQDVLERRSHWGEGLLGGWDWEGLKKDEPKIADQVIAYLALLHLTMEVATGEGGFCTQ
jgi:hypothetical protein